MNTPKISVIVPVYNVERYLPKCIESILSQTFTDFELLLIDDGSTDGSGKICDAYAEKDSRIRVFHQENRGVSAARNLGIDEAAAEWICFVDSDDWVERTYLSDLYGDGLVQKESLVYQQVFVDYGMCQEPKNIQKGFPNIILYESFLEEQICEYKILDDFFVLAKMFSKDLIMKNGIRFCENITISEDVTFLRTCLQYVKEIHLRASFSYHYMKRDIITLSNKARSSEEWLRVSDAIMKANLGILDRFPRLDAEYVRKVFTLNGLLQLYYACINVNKDNYFSVFNYVRGKKHLFDEFFFSFNIEQRLFKSLFFMRWIPCYCKFLAIRIYMRNFR